MLVDLSRTIYVSCGTLVKIPSVQGGTTLSMDIVLMLI
jgi:hypothetical protein